MQRDYIDYIREQGRQISVFSLQKGSNVNTYAVNIRSQAAAKGKALQMATMKCSSSSAQLNGGLQLHAPL